MRFVRIFLDFIGWLQIILGSTLIGGMVGGLLYYFFNNTTGYYIFITITCLCFLVGVIWATRIWIKNGTVEWLSRIRRVS